MMMSKMELIVRDRWLNKDAKCRLCSQIFCCTEHRSLHEKILHPQELRSILADIGNKDSLNTTVRTVKVRKVGKEQESETRSLKSLKATHSPDCTGKREREEVTSPLLQSHKKKKKRTSLLPHLKTLRDSPLALINNGVNLRTLNDSSKSLQATIGDESGFKKICDSPNIPPAVVDVKESRSTLNNGPVAANDEINLQTHSDSPRNLPANVDDKDSLITPNNSIHCPPSTFNDEKSHRTPSESPKSCPPTVGDKDLHRSPKDSIKSPSTKFDNNLNLRTPHDSPKSQPIMDNTEEYLTSPHNPVTTHSYEVNGDSTIYVSANTSYDMLTSSPFASPDASNFINLTPIEKSDPDEKVERATQQNSVEIITLEGSIPIDPQLSGTINLEDSDVLIISGQSSTINLEDSNIIPEKEMSYKKETSDEKNENRTETSEMEITSESSRIFNLKVQESLSKISKKKTLSEVKHENTNSTSEHKIDSGFQSETSNMIEGNRSRRLSTDSDLCLRDCNISRDFSLHFEPRTIAGLCLDASNSEFELGDRFICLNQELKNHPNITYERGNNADLMDFSFEMGHFNKDIDFLSPVKTKSESEKSESPTNISETFNEKSFESSDVCTSETQLEGVGYVNIETNEIYIPIKCFETELSTIHEVSHFNTKHENIANTIVSNDKTVREVSSVNESEISSSESRTKFPDVSKINNVNTVIHVSYAQDINNDSTVSEEDAGSMCTQFPENENFVLSFQNETQEYDKKSEICSQTKSSYTEIESSDRTTQSFREEDFDLSLPSLTDSKRIQETSLREKSVLISEGIINYNIKIDDLTPSEESIVRKCISSLTEKIVSLLPFKFSVTKTCTTFSTETCTIDLEKYGLHNGELEEHIRMRLPIREYTTTLELSRKLIRPIDGRAPYHVPGSLVPSVVTLKEEPLYNDSLFSEDDSYYLN